MYKKIIETADKIAPNIECHNFKGRLIGGGYTGFFERIGDIIEESDAHIIAVDANYGDGKSTLINGNNTLNAPGLVPYLTNRLDRPIVIIPGDGFQIDREERTRRIDAVEPNQTIRNANEIFFRNKLYTEYVQRIHDYFRPSNHCTLLELPPIRYDAPGAYYKADGGMFCFNPIPPNAIVVIDRTFSYTLSDRSLIDIGVFLWTPDSDMHLERILERTKKEQSRTPEFIRKRQLQIQRPTYDYLMKECNYLEGFHFLILNNDIGSPNIYEAH